jgi:hypothetical protein
MSSPKKLLPRGGVRIGMRKSSLISGALGLKDALPGLDPGIHVFLPAAWSDF